MKYIYTFFLFFFLISCSKPKTVLICGDHICINKAEAEQYFEDNLTIEVKIINKKEESNIGLVELNLIDNKKDKRKISLSLKDDTNVNLKILSNEEITNIKENIKIKKIENKIAKKSVKKLKNNNITNKEKIVSVRKNMNRGIKNETDICIILEKCNINEISKYLLEQGKKKKFPNITTRQ